MAFTLWALLEAGLLLVNAICVLHEQRFLAKGKFRQDLNKTDIQLIASTKSCQLYRS